MSVTSPVTGRVTGIVASGVTRAIGHRKNDVFVVNDTDAAAYITAVEAADSSTLENGVKAAIDNFVKGCKADGIWDAIKASCILAGARTLAGCLVPLVGTAPTNVGPFVTGDYNRITGLIGNGSSKHLDSNRANNADPQNSKHIAMYGISGAGSEFTGNVLVMGGRAGGDGMTYMDNAVGIRARINSSVVADTAVDPRPFAFLGGSRAISTAVTTRAAGITTSKPSAVQTPQTETALVFARRNLDTGNAEYFSKSRILFYSIGESLNLANLDTRVSRLLCEIEFGINTGLAGTGYDLDTLKYVNAGYAAGGTLA